MYYLSSSIGFRTPGRFGAWRRKSGFAGVGRRVLPRALVLELWDQGLTAVEIVDYIGLVRGVKFSYGSVGRVIDSARRDGYVRYHRDPARDLSDGFGEITPARQRALGL